MTPDQLKLLKCLPSVGAMTVTNVARKMWPTSTGWRVANGRPVTQVAKRMLNNLVKKGHVTSIGEGYALTAQGRDARHKETAKQEHLATSPVHHTTLPCGAIFGKKNNAWSKVTCEDCLFKKRTKPKGSQLRRKRKRF